MIIKKLKDRNIITPIPITKLLPNLVTLFALIIGVSSLRFALESAWEASVYCILVATILDGIDGRLARMLNSASHFGAELDSLCDLVNFGLCPAILIYLWSFQQYEYNVFSWTAIMLFIVCMAIRLARFNTDIGKPSDDSTNIPKFFTGVPAPAGAMLALIPIILDFEITSSIDNFSIRNHTLGINIYIIIVALLLPSKIPTISLKSIYIKPEYLSMAMIFVGSLSILAVIYTWYLLPIIATIYIISIPTIIYLNKDKKL